MAPEHDARTRAFYDHESDDPAPRRRRAAADWGVNEDIFDRMPSRRFRRPRADHHDEPDAHRFERRLSGPSGLAPRAPAARTLGRRVPPPRDDWTDEYQRRQIARRPGDWPQRDDERRADDGTGPPGAARRWARGERYDRAAPGRAPRDERVRRAAPGRAPRDERVRRPPPGRPASHGPAPRTVCRSRTESARSTRGWRRTPTRNSRWRPGRAGPSCSRRRGRTRGRRRAARRAARTPHGDDHRASRPGCRRRAHSARRRRRWSHRARAGPDRGICGPARVRARADRRAHHWSIIDIQVLRAPPRT